MTLRIAVLEYGPYITYVSVANVRKTYLQKIIKHLV